MAGEDVIRAEDVAGQGGYQFTADEQVEAMWEPAGAQSRWIPVTIVLRTLVLTAEGHWHPVYQVRDRDYTEWIAGEGELRRRSGGDGA